jgi:protein phosphatase
MTLAANPARPCAGLALDFSGLSHSGTARTRNQDAWMVDAEIGLLLVADGVGGQGDGSWASSRAVKLVRRHLRLATRYMRPRTNQDRERLIHAALRFCSKQMHRHAVLVGGKRSGTTLVGFWAPPDQAGSATAFNIGDSSLFRITQNAIAKLSHDHSLRQIWVDGGRIGAEPSKRVITQAMGISPEIHAHITSFAIAAGESYVVCTDGLTGALSDPEIWKNVRMAATASDGSRALLENALKHQAQDNVTAAVCKVRSR